MSIFTKEDKSKIAFAGLEAGLKIFNDHAEVSRQKRLKDLEDNSIDLTEYNRVCEELNEYEKMIHNIISDTELNSKLRRTEEIFVSIMQIIMFDLERDNKEVFENLCHFIDNEDFINGHDLALKKRKNRIENEYQELLKEYEVEFKEYEEQLRQHKSKGFFKRMLSTEVLEMPVKPMRRE